MPFFDFKTAGNALELNALDGLIIKQFENINDREKLKLFESLSVSSIVKIAHHSEQFASFCNKPELEGYWSKRWCAYGALLSTQTFSRFVFYAQPKSNNFDLVRGAYFFHLSQAVKEQAKKDFIFSEIKLIEIAINYGSIHAVQRYQQYLYQQIANSSNEDIEDLYNQLIQLNMSTLAEYGSYGYMMLADALSHYALWLLPYNREEAEGVYNSALESLDAAESILEASKFSIHNASLGQGLGCSNTLGIETPQQAKQFLIEASKNACQTAIPKSNNSSLIASPRL